MTQKEQESYNRLLEACKAGAKYCDALKRWQDAGITGPIVGTDELDRLFEDWHDKTHLALDNL